jgi:hypothetical protein
MTRLEASMVEDVSRRVKLSKQITSWPSSNDLSRRCEPTNPAPPVTSTLMKTPAKGLSLDLAQLVRRYVVVYPTSSRRPRVSGIGGQPMVTNGEALDLTGKSCRSHVR